MDKNKGAEQNETALIKNPPDLEETLVNKHEEAEKDIEKDPDFKNDPTDDLDEGELARLEGED